MHVHLQALLPCVYVLSMDCPSPGRPSRRIRPHRRETAAATMISQNRLPHHHSAAGVTRSMVALPGFPLFTSRTGIISVERYGRNQRARRSRACPLKLIAFVCSRTPRAICFGRSTGNRVTLFLSSINRMFILRGTAHKNVYTRLGHYERRPPGRSVPPSSRPSVITSEVGQC